MEMALSWAKLKQDVYCINWAYPMLKSHPDARPLY